MRIYVTLFDKGFLNRGLCLYRSVTKNTAAPFQFWVLCMDDETYEILTKLKLPHLRPVSHTEFENEELKTIKTTRTLEEYCWTLSAWSTWYVMEKNPEAESVTYLDADLFFYSTLEPIYTAFNGNSVMLIPHRISNDKKSREHKVGRYNVGMLIFKNDISGNACLTWWKEKCIEWCYNKVESTRFGDQKYLDYFEEKFKGVFILPWKGVNLAYWNINSHKGKVLGKDGDVYIDDDKLIFFHFSRFKLYYPESSWLPYGPPGFFTMNSPEKRLVYDAYAKALYRAMADIRSIRPDFTFGTLPRPHWYQQLFGAGLYSAKTAIKRAFGL